LGFFYTTNLGSPVNLTSLELVNRADDSPERLSNYRVQILEADGTTVAWTGDIRTDHTNSGYGGIDTITAGNGTGTFAGQYVRVTNLSGANYNPQIAELRAFGTAVPSKAYEAWALFHAPLSSSLRSADVEGDGLTNLHEFLFGGNPKSGADQALQVSADVATATVRWLGRSASTQASYSVETSATLNNPWTASSAIPTDAADQTNVPTGYTRYQATIARDGARRFYRVVGSEL
jgi:hypothetical protein